MTNFSQTEIETKIVELLGSHFKIQKADLPSPHESFDNVGISSLEKIRLLSELERVYEIWINDDEYLECHSISGIAKVCSKYINQKK